MPRAIECLYQDDAGWVHLPRGAVDLLRRRLRAIGEEVIIEDQRVLLSALGLAYEVRLRPNTPGHGGGIQGQIVLPCGGGKTGIGIGAMAQSLARMEAGALDELGQRFGGTSSRKPIKHPPRISVMCFRTCPPATASASRPPRSATLTVGGEGRPHSHQESSRRIVTRTAGPNSSGCG